MEEWEYPAGVVLEAPLTSVAAVVADTHLRLVPYRDRLTAAIRAVLYDHFDSLSKVPLDDLLAPVLVLHGQRDNKLMDKIDLAAFHAKSVGVRLEYMHNFRNDDLDKHISPQMVQWAREIQSMQVPLYAFLSDPDTDDISFAFHREAHIKFDLFKKPFRRWLILNGWESNKQPPFDEFRLEIESRGLVMKKVQSTMEESASVWYVYGIGDRSEGWEDDELFRNMVCGGPLIRCKACSSVIRENIIHHDHETYCSISCREGANDNRDHRKAPGQNDLRDAVNQLHTLFSEHGLDITGIKEQLIGMVNDEQR